MWQQWRKKAGGTFIRAFFEGLARAGKYWPDLRKVMDGLDIIHNVSYGPDKPWHLLDVYRRRDRETGPALLYIHGGAFRILSKDTHWMMASMFAQAGFTVFNINYRLAPAYPYPAALEDAALAYHWLSQNAAEFKASTERLVVAGESAGANLSLALTLSACFERPELFAKRVFDTGLVPKAVIPMCGILQVSDAERFVRKKPHMRRLVADRLAETERGYLAGQQGALLADPLTVLETSGIPVRPLPPMYAAVGTRDPLLDDTRRLGAALARRGVHHQIAYFPNEIHAFHAFTFRKTSQECWRQQLAFLDNWC
jgi:acetyl esterase